MGILPHQLLPVTLVQVEYVGGLAQLVHLHVPVEVEQLGAADGHLAYAVVGILVPRHRVDRPALDGLRPAGSAVYRLKSDAIQEGGQDLGDLVGLLLVGWLPGQDVGSRIVVGIVRMEIRDAGEQVAAHGLHLLSLAVGGYGVPLHVVGLELLPGADVLHVALSIPLFIPADHLVQGLLGRLELLQLRPRLLHVVLADPLQLALFSPALGLGIRHGRGILIYFFVLVHDLLLRSPFLMSRYVYRGLSSHLSSGATIRGGTGFAMAK